MNPILAELHWPIIGLRAGVVAGALVVWFWTQSLIARKSAPKAGLGDVIHDLTARWHQYFSTHDHAANAALITSSIFIDLFGLSLIGAAIFGPTFAPFLAILIVFGLRQICQGLCTLPPPPGIIWRNPGFPALLVTYDVGNDFFFSGHTALAVLGAMEAAHLGPPWLAVIAASIALGEMLVVLVLRAHYTLDVVAGALAAFLAAEIAGWMSLSWILGCDDMSQQPQVSPPGGLPAPVASFTGPEAELHLGADLQTLREIVAGLDRLEERLDSSPIPAAVTARGYFTPDEDDRVRQGVLAYRNYRLAAYEIILRYRDYASIEPVPRRLRCFLVAFGAALVLYAKSLKIISFAEHVPMLRAKINEPDSKYDLEAGFFDDVLAGYSRICNYRSILQADSFWRAHRREAQALADEAGGDWVWLADLIRHQRHAVRRRLLHVLWQRLRYDWRAFGQTLLSPFRQARHGLESLLGDRLADAEVTGQPTQAITSEIVATLRPGLQPGDVLLVREDSRLTAAILPGFWTHAALFLGGRSDLEALGLHSHPHVLRHWHEIPENSGPLGLVIEALFPRVQLNSLEKCLRVDHLVVLRSGLPVSDIAAAIGEALAHLGKPYDFEFDFNNSSRIVCTGLVYRSYHNRGAMAFSLTKRLGRFTLTGDDIIAHALDGLGEPGEAKIVRFQPVALVLKRRDGQAHAVPPERILPLLRRIRRGWRPARRVKSRVK